MANQVNRDGRWRLRALWAGAILYALILPNGLVYARQLPYPILILGTIINGSIFALFVIEIRKVYKGRRIRHEGQQLDATPEVTAAVNPRKIRLLWLAAGFYCVIMLVGIQYAAKLPYPVLPVAGVINIAIMSAFIFMIRKAYLQKQR